MWCYRSFNWALSCGGTVPLQEGLENPEMPGMNFLVQTLINITVVFCCWFTTNGEISVKTWLIISDGTGEFLDAWLLLVEKMVNTKNILESPHTLPAKSTQPGFVSFDALQYLIKTQKVRTNFSRRVNTLLKYGQSVGQ